MMEGIYTRYSDGYSIWETEAESRHMDGVAIARRQEKGWHLEGVRKYSPNMVSFTITAGRKLWYVVSEYVPTKNQTTVLRVE